MQLTFRPLQWYDVDSIITWRYDGLYARYNLFALHLLPYIRLRALLKWMGRECYAVEDEQRFLVGYFMFRKLAHRKIEIGLGMRPDLTGRGYGLSFVEAGLAFGKQRYGAKRFRLFVADFNLRAMKVYTRAGFQMVRPVTREFAQGLTIYKGLYHEMQRDA